jgi:hypothetical protein
MNCSKTLAGLKNGMSAVSKIWRANHIPDSGMGRECMALMNIATIAAEVETPVENVS